LLQLLSNDRKNLNINTIKLIKTTKCSCRC